MLLTAVASALPLIGLIAPAGVFAASPPAPTTSCGNANYGQIKYTTNISSKTYARAHPDVVFTLAPGGSASRTLTSTTTVKGSVTGTLTLNGDAQAILVSLGASVSVELSFGVAFTYSDAWTIGPIRNSTSSYRQVTTFAGTRVVNGNATRWKCGMSPNTGWYTWLTERTGTYFAINQTVTGMAWCTDDAAIKAMFGTWSLEYDAVSKC